MRMVPENLDTSRSARCFDRLVVFEAKSFQFRFLLATMIDGSMAVRHILTSSAAELSTTMTTRTATAATQRQR